MKYFKIELCENNKSRKKRGRPVLAGGGGEIDLTVHIKAEDEDRARMKVHSYLKYNYDILFITEEDPDD